jgi:hypothetical protein
LGHIRVGGFLCEEEATGLPADRTVWSLGASGCITSGAP